MLRPSWHPTPSQSVKSLPTYEMQCVDCHNRPTHTFDLPDRAMDKALADGDISVSLPFIKKEGVELLKANYATSEEASSKLPVTLLKTTTNEIPRMFT